MTKKRNGIEKWRKFVLRKERKLKFSTVQKVKDFILTREKEILEDKINQSQNYRQKLSIKIYQEKVTGLNNILKKQIITKHILYLKDIFQIFRDTKLAEEQYQVFSKILGKFKRVRTAGVLFKALKYKVELRRKERVLAERRQSKLKLYMMRLLNFNVWHMRQRRLAIKNFLNVVAQPFARKNAEVFVEIEQFVNPELKHRLEIDYQKLNTGVF